MKKRFCGFSHVPITGPANQAFNCNELTFVNKGTIGCTIFSGGPLYLSAGQAVTYPCFHPEDINQTVYKFVFDAKANGCLIIAICKNYL